MAILFPVINGECSQAEGDGSTDAELRACAAKLADTFTNLHAKLDGKPLKRLKRFRFASPLFTFSPVAGNPIGIPPATNSPSVADGYWVMLKKLKKGTHTLSFGGDVTAEQTSPPRRPTSSRSGRGAVVVGQPWSGLRTKDGEDRSFLAARALIPRPPDLDRSRERS